MRKLVEQVFGWMKTVGLLRKLRHRGGERGDWVVTFTAATHLWSWSQIRGIEGFFISLLDRVSGGEERALLSAELTNLP